MDFFYVDNKIVEITQLGYKDFDLIAQEFGYPKEKDDSQHQYFAWRKINHFSLSYRNINLKKLGSIVIGEAISDNEYFYVRLRANNPVLKISKKNLFDFIEDICFEVDFMGWEAISINGKYILEFCDQSSYLIKSNFDISNWGRATESF